MAMAATGATIARCGGPGGRRPQRVDPSASTRFRKEGEDHGEHAVVELARSTEEEKQRQLERLADLQARHSGELPRRWTACATPRSPARTCSPSSWTPRGAARWARSARRCSRSGPGTAATSDRRPPTAVTSYA